MNKLLKLYEHINDNCEQVYINYKPDFIEIRIFTYKMINDVHVPLNFFLDRMTIYFIKNANNKKK